MIRESNIMSTKVTECCKRIEMLGSLILRDLLNEDIEQARKEYDYLLANVQNLGRHIASGENLN